ncbi:MAG: hypothetical protein IJJ33_19575 [Victivallales bacterium]|nr:hypothetical protein [Victivallales bacterium]
MNKQWYLVMAAALTLAGASYAQTAPKAAQPAAVQQLAAQSVDTWVGQFEAMSKSTDKAQKDGFAATAQAALNAMDTAKANSIAAAVNNKVKGVGIAKVNNAWSVMFNLTEDGDSAAATPDDVAEANAAIAALAEFSGSAIAEGKSEATVDFRLDAQYWEDQDKEMPFDTDPDYTPGPEPIPPHPVSGSSSR